MLCCHSKKRVKYWKVILRKRKTVGKIGEKLFGYVISIFSVFLCYHSFHHNTINFLEMCNFRCFILILSWLSLFLLLPLIDNPLKNYEIWCYLLLHAYIGFSFLYKFPFVTKVVEMEQERGVKCVFVPI